MGKQRVSIVIQNVGDKNYLLNFLKQLKPTSVVVINNPDLLREILDTVPEIEAGVIRFYREDDAYLWKDKDGLNWLLQRWDSSGLPGNPRAYLYVSNEPVVGTVEELHQMVDWHTNAAIVLRQHVIHAVMMNISSATMGRGVVESGVFDDFLRQMADGWHIFGFHEYSNAIPPLSTAGRPAEDMLDPAKCQPNNWPSPYDVQIGSLDGDWLIGRIYWWDEQAKKLGLKIPRKLITEGGQDHQTDQKGDYVLRQLEARYGKGSYLDLRGWNSFRGVLEAYYKDTYPAPVFEHTIFEFLKWWMWVYDDTLYRGQSEPSIIGMTLFIWSPDKSDWDIQYGFDYSKNRVLHQMLWDWSTELYGEKPMPEPTPMPVVVTQAVVVKSTDPKVPVRFRSEPTTAAAVIDHIIGEVPATEYIGSDVPMVSGGVTYTMRKFDLKGNTGWAAIELLAINQQDTDPSVSVKRSVLDAVVSGATKLQAKVAEVNREINDLMTLVGTFSDDTKA